MTLEITTTLNPNPTSDERLAEILADPGFGNHFTDHMLRIEWTPENGWHNARIEPYGPLSLDPATSVLHYAQETFEGLKAYRHADGTIWGFRPDANAARMAKSSDRLAFPVLETEDFVAAIAELVKVDARWVPEAAEGEEKSLYIRPFMFASETFLGVRAARHVTFMVILSPAGSYFSGGIKPVKLWLSRELTRAGRGGMGAAKTGGNYASSLAAQEKAYAQGCDQVMFLDAAEGEYLEELGGMNIFFVYGDGRLVTPATSGTILEGITRASLLEIAAEQGLKVEERPVAFSEWVDGVASGEITEVFACGTAAVITPVGELLHDDGSILTPNPGGPVTTQLRSTLVDLQFGRTDDTHGWTHQFV